MRKFSNDGIFILYGSVNHGAYQQGAKIIGCLMGSFWWASNDEHKFEKVLHRCLATMGILLMKISQVLEQLFLQIDDENFDEVTILLIRLQKRLGDRNPEIIRAKLLINFLGEGV